MRRAVLILALLVAACGPGTQADKKPDTEAAPGVHLSAEDVKSLGIETVAAKPATYQREITGYGVVVPLDTIAQSDADYLTASAAVAQSAAAAARARSLATGDEAAVSREVVEAADSKAKADQAALALARRKAEAAFGVNAPWHNPAERAAIMARLASGRTVLVRVTFPLGALGRATPKMLKITQLGDNGQSWTTKSLWDAPADPSFPGRGFFALVDDSDLAQNEHVIAAVPVGTLESGIAVPASALVMGEGESAVYVETAPNQFLRTQIDTSRPLSGGYFISPGSGIALGQKIVTNGAGLLLSHEINPSSDAGD